MRNYLLRAALTYAFEKDGALPDEIERYEARTRRLLDSDSYPCPLCFARGEEQPLEVRLAGDWVDQAFCPKCKRLFHVPVPKE